MTGEERWLRHAARRWADRDAVVAGDETLSYIALERRARQLGARLASAGVGRGDRVAVRLGTGLEHLLLVHAVAAVGAVLVEMNPRLTARELGVLLDEAEPVRLVIGDDPEVDALASARRAISFERLASLAPARDAIADRLDPNADFVILHTSGTTRRPKGVRLTVANLVAAAAASRERLGLEPDDRWLLCMPLHHVGGLSIPLRCAMAGAAVVLEAGFDAERVATRFERGEVTLASLVPTMLSRVLDAFGSRRAAPSLRAVLLGGGPVPASLIRRAMAHGVPVAASYGLTEAASQVATLTPAEIEAGLAGAGRPLAGIEVCILGEDGRAVPPGTVGEIAVRGPQVFAGYVGGPARSPDDWFATGDVGRIEPDGRLHPIDRRSDLIVSGGENVAPLEVESILVEHPSVSEAAVFGRDDPEWGHRVCAAVVPHPGAEIDPDALRAFCRARLAGFKVPREFELSARLPRTPSGKLRRAALRG